MNIERYEMCSAVTGVNHGWLSTGAHGKYGMKHSNKAYCKYTGNGRVWE